MNTPASEPSGSGTPVPFRRPWFEPFLAFAAIVAILKILYLFRSIDPIGRYIHLIALVLFLYTPLALVRWGRANSQDLGLTLKKAAPDLALVLALAVVVFPVFVLGFVVWHERILGLEWMGVWEFPQAGVLLTQFVAAALPEEVFYRGYVQSALERTWPPARRLLGAPVGRAIVVTSLLFALGHVVIEFSPVRAAVFFPSLVFGWLRARTGRILAPVLFHGLSNVAMLTLQLGLG